LLKPILAGAKEWLKLATLAEPSRQFDSCCKQLLFDATNTWGRLQRDLEKCGYGPDLLTDAVTIPSGPEGLVHQALWKIWRLCYDTESTQELRTELEWAIQALELHSTVAQESPELAVSWEGDDWDALEPQVRQLLSYMSALEEADLRELCPAVWGKEYLGENGVTEAARETLTSKANKFLRKRESPRLLRKVRNEPYLHWE